MRNLLIFSLALLFMQCGDPKPEPVLTLNPDDHIALVGGNLCSRMMEFGHFETELHLRFPEHNLVIRNMCDGGNTPGFQPHSARMEPWAFQGANAFYEDTGLDRDSDPQGDFPTPDEWLERVEADVILGFFGWSESFDGPDRLETFKEELAAWIEWNTFSEWNGESEARIALVSPTYFQNVTDRLDVPEGTLENKNLALYTEAMREVAAENGIPFIDLFDVTEDWFSGNNDMTTDGVQLTDEAYAKLAPYLADHLFGGDAKESLREEIHTLVNDKNWYWQNDYKIPNGVHVYGRRHTPFGPDNYPMELKKIQEMTMIRDTAIWMALQGKEMDIAAADAKTYTLPPVETNYSLVEEGEEAKYLYGEEAMSTFTVADGFKMELFASEEDFPELANPCQMSFDNKGRLWVACMPTYPHYKPGDSKPNDKLVIIEDADNDGKADKTTVFADDLHVPVGFEFAPEGVYVSQGTNLVLLKDTDGDDRYDEKEIVLSGFDDHDTHHTTSAFTTDPSGAIIMGEGIFLHTNVETPYGPVRATNGGFYRFQPQKRHLERFAQIPIPNPWGTAFDQWGQPFFLHTSDPAVRWMAPSTIRNHYGTQAPMSRELIPDDHRVRPTSGVEFVSSRHFPEEMQGDMIYNNTIGFLGTKQFSIEDDGTGYKMAFRQDLLRGTDTNFRPVDLEFAPDGSLYIVDWHNVLVGHMQHNARDPLRDHVHGRIYRITYPSRPLVEPAQIDGAPIATLLDNLKLPEYRTRYRTQRELRGRDADEVKSAVEAWVAGLDANDPNYERWMLEGLWATWGANNVSQEVLEKVLAAKDYRVRAGAVQVLRYAGDQIEGATNMLNALAADEHGRVRLNAVTAATWLPEDAGRMVINTAQQHPIDDWMEPTFTAAPKFLTGEGLKISKGSEIVVNHLKGADLEQFSAGWDIYHEDGSCMTCHQKTGKGLNASGFPPIAGSSWVEGDPKVLAKILLKGLIGPIVVNGREFPGQVPMTPYEDMLNDEQMANVMTYVRNAFGNRSSVISPEFVAKVRAEVEASGHKGYYKAEDLRPVNSKK
ncbi:PVC-type heme-binding CxxCH protein [Lewinella sp. 4G2]|uniref:PVC-type heme-binding CxxCH protein n=1 Tax=Lewinella sp. 4G2 TaxID=1803372 RepID=UPI0007B4F1AD|nr:PVC-type heme-binding CxxCH protein [Lewinella sp. 4G2]OAV43719.1 dehydrogenase [Lewinella sp. 4G2]